MTSAGIASIRARQILDSRGDPTVEVEAELESGATGRAAVPSGASTGRFEAVELRDGGEAYRGKGVLTAVRNVETEIAPALTGLDARDQAAIDRALVELDGTDNKGRLGANAILGCSLVPLRRPRPPMPRCRCTGGSEGRCPHLARADAERRQRRRPRAERARPPGIHARPARRRELRRGAPDRSRDVPRPPRRSSRPGLSTGVGDEGGFAPEISTAEEAIEAILLAAEHAGHRDRIALALDPAATELFEARLYRFEGEDTERDGGTMIEFYAELAERYPLVSIEDGLGGRMGRLELLTEQLGDRLQLVGDDLFVTSVDRLRRGIEEQVANAILVKVNQIGTLTEALEAIEIAREHGYGRSFPPLRRDRGHDYRRSRGRHERRADQDGRAVSHRPRSEVQPTAPHRSGARRDATYPGWDAFPERGADALSPKSAPHFRRRQTRLRMARRDKPGLADEPIGGGRLSGRSHNAEASAS